MVYFLPSQPPVSLFYCLVFLGLGFYFLQPSYLKVIAFALFGFCWVSLYLVYFSPSELPVNWQKKNLVVEGKVVSLVAYQKDSQTFRFKTDEVNHNNCQWLLRLGIYHHHLDIQPGQRWRFTVRLKRPHNSANPGGFNMERWMRAQGLTASGYVVSGEKQKTIIPTFHDPILMLRAYLHREIEYCMNHSKVSGLVQALAIGDKGQVPQYQRLLFQKTGTSHLLAISGLHIGFAAAIFYGLMFFLWRRLTRLSMVFPAQKAAAMAAIVAGVMYSLLAGFSLPTQRAVVMLMVLMLYRLRSYPLPAWRALKMALWIILLADPLAILSVSFWLSFGAVFVISYCLWGRWDSRRRWRKSMHLQWSITMGLTPLMLLYFQQISLVSPIANVIAIPFTGFIIVPLILFACLFLFLNHAIASFLFYLSGKCLEGLLWFLKTLSDLPHSTYSFSISSHIGFLFIVAAILLMLLPKGIPARYLSLVLLLPSLFPFRTVLPYGQAEMTVLDVGQGLAVFIQTAHHTLLYDTGPRYSSDSDAGESIIFPYLSFNGISHLDTIIVSHADSDPSGGVHSLLSSESVAEILTSDPRGIHVNHAKRCRAGQHWVWDGVHFNILYPNSNRQGSTNNRSCILKVTTGNSSALLPGDIEKPVEQWLFKYDSNELKSSILIAPHHGSQTSSSFDFLRTVSPEWVVFSVGYLNRFHFPNSLVVHRYSVLGVKMLQTDKSGAIQFGLSAAGVRLLDQYRDNLGWV